jgi:PDZ domain
MRRSAQRRRRISLPGLFIFCTIVTAFLAIGPMAGAQTSPQQQQPPAQADSSDQTLEIAPRVEPPPSPPATEPEQPPASQRQPAVGTPADYEYGFGLGPPVTIVNNPKRPYLGIAARFIIAKPQAGQKIPGLEIVSVDPNSPAARAGLRGRTAPTSLGATAETAGNLLMPLGLGLLPLLERSGQLGHTGDLIVAIDDHRVKSETDLANELDTLKPGDTIYLTVLRNLENGKRETLKAAVKLGKPGEAAAGKAKPRHKAATPVSTSSTENRAQ